MTHFFPSSTALNQHSLYQKSCVSTFMVVSMIGLLSGCQQPPPSERRAVTLPVYQAGNADNGKILYDELCENCHKLEVGQNKKAPQLLNIYGAPAGELTDYKYSDVMLNSGWVWDAQTLDNYITDAQTAMPDTRMFSDAINSADERADIIAYLSTLRVTPKPTPEQ